MYLNKYLRSGISRLRQTASGAGNFIVFLMRRAQSDTIFRVAASLSYTSLIAIVPLLAIGLAIFSAFPVFQGAKEQLQEIILQNFVPNIEQEISQYFADFINATAQLTAIGVIGIAVTAILMLSTIENSLNFIFKVYKPRNIKSSGTLYWTVITLGPLLLGTALSLRGYVYTLQKFMPEDIISSQFYLSTLIPSLFTTLALVLLYVLVPNKKVRLSNAVIGAVVAMMMFFLLRKFFGLAISASATYKTLYGAMATLPILLIWIYCSWAVVIFGAVVTAAIGEYREREAFSSEENAEDSYVSRRSRRKKRYYAKKFLPKEQK